MSLYDIEIQVLYMFLEGDVQATTFRFRFVVADIFKIYRTDHTYGTVQLPMDATVDAVVKQAVVKMSLPDEDLVLCEVRSDGSKVALILKSLLYYDSYTFNSQTYPPYIIFVKVN